VAEFPHLFGLEVELELGKLAGDAAPFQAVKP
jgi:hypothetical protein